jgi:tetraacyldisaccharide 4'-kinase
LLDSLYGQVMRVRRRWAERHPDRRRRLARPVVSVGNLSMGGTGKSPVVAAIARWLMTHGERPAILSRGYARADAVDGVVVVSDGTRVLASIDRAGDEPLMLARQVPGAVVCVSPDRYLAGTLAERQLGCTVHLLDDGFQHIELARNLDILVTMVGEIPQGRVIPNGRLREPMDAAARAHVLVVSGATAGAAAAEAWALGISQSCGARRSLGAPIAMATESIRPTAFAEASAVKKADATTEGPVGKVLAVAGIAIPQRFADSLKEAQWPVADLLAFPDHHRYSQLDVERIARRMRESGAASVFTTEKDAVRFEALGPLPFPLFRVPLTVEFDPPDVVFESVRAVLA